MAVASDHEFVGSVSGGCVEASVVEQATEVLQSREPRLLEFGVDNDLAWSVGLSCGGQIRVLLEYFPSFSDDASEREVGISWLDALRGGKPCVVVSWFEGPDHGHCLVFPDGRVVGNQRSEISELGRRRQSELTQSGGQDAFIHVIRGREILLIVGATDIATHLVRFAKHLDFQTVVIDPRPVFTDPSRFDPEPDRILSAWPDEALADLSLTADTYAVLLSHNPRIDDPALHRLLGSGVRYIGALGSRKTQEKRRQRLVESGFSNEQVSRIRGPVGLSIGAASPAEIALSIMAEIVASRNSTTVD